MLPIVQRELQTAARSPKLYRRRTLAAAVVVTFISLLLIFGSTSRHARGYFDTISSLALLVCLVEGIRKSADAISIERREGTLGLLFLSTLSGWDIILGKLSSALLRSLNTLLALVPIFAISLLMGGTTGGEFWRVILVLLLTLLMSLSLCLCLSTLTREGSLVASIFIIAVLCIAPSLSQLHRTAAEWILPLSPFFTHRGASDPYYSFDSSFYWLGIAYLAGITLVSLSVASFVLPRTWQDRPFKTRSNTGHSTPLSPKLRAARRAMLDRNAVMWLLFNPRSHRLFRVFLLALSTYAVFGAAAVLLSDSLFDTKLSGLEWFFPSTALAALALVVSLRVARSTSRAFADARANGALELILSTPMKVDDIIAGQWLALRADLRPAIIIFSILAALVLAFVSITTGGAGILSLVKGLVEVVLGIPTVAAVGVWMGLTSRTPSRAFFRTVAFGLVAPHLVCTPTVVNQLVLLTIALDKVKGHFRRFVAEQYFGNSKAFLAPPLPAQTNVPPVLRQSPGATQ